METLELKLEMRVFLLMPMWPNANLINICTSTKMSKKGLNFTFCRIRRQGSFPPQKYVPAIENNQVEIVHKNNSCKLKNSLNVR